MEKTVTAARDGFVSHIDCDEAGICSLILGGGRETKESAIDLSVGLLLSKKVGDMVKQGETLATLYGNDAAALSEAVERYKAACHITEGPVEKRSLIRGMIC